MAIQETKKFGILEYVAFSKELEFFNSLVEFSVLCLKKHRYQIKT
jgi:hypothetical protein